MPTQVLRSTFNSSKQTAGKTQRIADAHPLYYCRGYRGREQAPGAVAESHARVCPLAAGAAGQPWPRVTYVLLVHCRWAAQQTNRRGTNVPGHRQPEPARCHYVPAHPAGRYALGSRARHPARRFADRRPGAGRHHANAQGRLVYDAGFGVGPGPRRRAGAGRGQRGRRAPA